MTLLLLLAAVLIILIMIGVGRAATARPQPPAPARRPPPPDPIIDADLDPLIAPWADQPPAWQHEAEPQADDDIDFEPGGGDFGGGGASGSWDDGETN